MKKWRIWIQALRSLVISEWGTTIHTAINLLFAWTFLSWACMHTNYIFNTNKKFKARYIIHKICTFYKRKKIKEVFNSINNTYLNNVPIYKENIHFVWFVNNLSSWNTNFFYKQFDEGFNKFRKGKSKQHPSTLFSSSLLETQWTTSLSINKLHAIFCCKWKWCNPHIVSPDFQVPLFISHLTFSLTTNIFSANKYYLSLDHNHKQHYVI